MFPINRITHFRVLKVIRTRVSDRQRGEQPKESVKSRGKLQRHFESIFAFKMPLKLVSLFLLLDYVMYVKK